MQKMRNQEQLLSRSIDRQMEVINKQEKFLWETIENHKEMTKKTRKRFLEHDARNHTGFGAFA
jgi:hypothetical protein